LLFFEKDTINWSNLEMQKFYQTLTSLKHNNSALWNGSFGGAMQFVETSTPEKVLAFTREKDKNQILAVFNFSAEPVETVLELQKAGDYLAYFSGETQSLKKQNTLKLEPWGYQVFIMK